MKTYKNLEIGDKFTEYEMGYSEDFVVTESSKIEHVIEINGVKYNQYTWKASRIKTKEIVDFLITENLEHYGPNIEIYVD